MRVEGGRRVPCFVIRVGLAGEVEGFGGLGRRTLSGGERQGNRLRADQPGAKLIISLGPGVG